MLTRLLGLRGGKRRSVLPVSMIACLAFIALAIWGWGLPPQRVWEFLLISLVCLAVIVIAALAGAALIVLIRKLSSRE